MDFNKLTELLSELPPGVLCTSDDQGEVNGAVFGSTRLLEDDRLLIGLSENKTFVNLQKNPKACYVAYAPSSSILSSKGIRLYLELEAFESKGALFEEAVTHIEKNAGGFAAQAIKCIAIFRICRFRPLIDLPGKGTL